MYRSLTIAILFFLVLALTLSCAQTPGAAQEGPESPPEGASEADGATRPATGEDPETRPAAPRENTSDGPIALAYPKDTPLLFRLFKNGEQVADLECTVTETGTEANPTHRIQTKIEFDDGDRRYTQESETVVDARLSPVFYERNRVLVMAQGRARRECTLTLDEGEAKVSLTDNAGHVREHEKKLPVPCFLFDDLAVEQMALLAPVVHARGEGTYSVLAVEALKIYKFVFKRIRVEEVDGRKLTRWEFKDPMAFSGILWINADGTLEKYQQRYVEQLFEAIRVRE